VNIFQEIKALFTVKGFVQTEIKGATQMNGTKPGYLTTEFWVTALTNLIAVVGALKGIIPGNVATIALTVLNSVYAIVRTFVKTSDPTPVTTPPPAA